MSKKNNNKLPVISIITTFYNAEKFILNSINSVFQQIIENYKIEYVIVDDKSQDASRKIVETYFNENKKEGFILKLIEPQENLGCGGARKFGIDNASGDYFMFVDADDYYINRDFVKRAYNTIISKNADIVEYGVVYNTSDGNKTNNVSSQEITIENNKSLAKIALFKDNLIKFNVWSKIYKRWVVESYPYSISRTYEDVRTIPVWVHNANKIIIMPSVEINYRAAEGSIIRTDMVKTRLGTITAIAELFPLFKDDYNVLKAMYTRSMVDLEALLHNHSSNDPGFNEMSRLNTYMLSFLYPSEYKKVTYHIEDDPELHPELNNQNQELKIEDLPELNLDDNIEEQKPEEGYHTDEKLNELEIN